MRGDRPFYDIEGAEIGPFTPHARGSTRGCLTVALLVPVYPACAGIDLGLGFGLIWLSSLPRMRGDRPPLVDRIPSRPGFTPHARGSTQQQDYPYYAHLVYPACAGIDHCYPLIRWRRSCLPRMRGDRPWLLVKGGFRHKFTPHARGSTAIPPCDRGGPIVYPACAGIDL